MKLVMTLRARDEADIVDENVAFHLNAGVDFIVATDHRSVDGTREILESYEQQGKVHLIREDGPVRGDWFTPMARLAATEFGADSDRMYSATLGPGAERFQAPLPIDLNIGEATATWPALAMNRGGTAYLVYRVVTDTTAANPPG